MRQRILTAEESKSLNKAWQLIRSKKETKSSNVVNEAFEKVKNIIGFNNEIIKDPRVFYEWLKKNQEKTPRECSIILTRIFSEQRQYLKALAVYALILGINYDVMNSEEDLIKFSGYRKNMEKSLSHIVLLFLQLKRPLSIIWCLSNYLRIPFQDAFDLWKIKKVLNDGKKLTDETLLNIAQAYRIMGFSKLALTIYLHVLDPNLPSLNDLRLINDIKVDKVKAIVDKMHENASFSFLYNLILIAQELRLSKLALNLFEIVFGLKENQLVDAKSSQLENIDFKKKHLLELARHYQEMGRYKEALLIYAKYFDLKYDDLSDNFDEKKFGNIKNNRSVLVLLGLATLYECRFEFSKSLRIYAILLNCSFNDLMRDLAKVLNSKSKEHYDVLLNLARLYERIGLYNNSFLVYSKFLGVEIHFPLNEQLKETIKKYTDKKVLMTLFKTLKDAGQFKDAFFILSCLLNCQLEILIDGNFEDTWFENKNETNLLHLASLYSEQGKGGLSLKIMAYLLKLKDNFYFSIKDYQNRLRQCVIYQRKILLTLIRILENFGLHSQALFICSLLADVDNEKILSCDENAIKVIVNSGNELFHTFIILLRTIDPSISLRLLCRKLDLDYEKITDLTYLETVVPTIPNFYYALLAKTLFLTRKNESSLCLYAYMLKPDNGMYDYEMKKSLMASLEAINQKDIYRLIVLALSKIFSCENNPDNLESEFFKKIKGESISYRMALLWAVVLTIKKGGAEFLDAVEKRFSANRFPLRLLFWKYRFKLITLDDIVKRLEAQKQAQGLSIVAMYALAVAYRLLNKTDEYNEVLGEIRSMVPEPEPIIFAIVQPNASLDGYTAELLSGDAQIDFEMPKKTMPNAIIPSVGLWPPENIENFKTNFSNPNFIPEGIIIDKRRLRLNKNNLSGEKLWIFYVINFFVKYKAQYKYFIDQKLSDALKEAAENLLPNQTELSNLKSQEEKLLLEKEKLLTIASILIHFFQDPNAEQLWNQLFSLNVIFYLFFNKDDKVDIKITNSVLREVFKREIFPNKDCFNYIPYAITLLNCLYGKFKTQSEICRSITPRYMALNTAHVRGQKNYDEEFPTLDRRYHKKL